MLRGLHKQLDANADPDLATLTRHIDRVRRLMRDITRSESLHGSKWQAGMTRYYGRLLRELRARRRELNK